MIQILQVLLLFNMITRQLMKIVPCDTMKKGGVIYLAINTQMICDDDPYAEQLNYKNWFPIYTHDASSYTVYTNSTTTCKNECRGCYELTQKCMSCSSQTRGPFPSLSDIILQRGMDCECNSGMIEFSQSKTNPCVCKARNYYMVQNDKSPYYYCLECPLNYESCFVYYYNASSPPIPSQCAAGVGRVTLQNSPTCSCQSKYQEYSPIQKDCRLKCSAPCAECVGDSESLCSTCQDILMTINSIQMCVCPSNYYMDGTSNAAGEVVTNFCVLCHYSCNTCATQSTTCTSCLVTNNRMMASGTCPCNKYYFEIDNQPECLPCHWTCDSCKSLDSCDSCIEMSNREVNYDYHQDYFCNCKIGYAEDLSSNTCLPCQDTCLTCVTTTDTCTSCDDTQYRELANYRCQCVARYFEKQDNIICQQCAPTCLNCDGDSDSNCLTCEVKSFRILNNQKQCQCKQGYGYDYQMAEQCIQCTGICLKCDFFDHCIQCPYGINRVLDSNNICQCDDGFYEDLNNSICKPCHHSCLTCDQGGQANCLTCDAELGRTFNNDYKICECSPGYFEFYNKCIACYYSCQTCISQFQDGCTSCPFSRILSDQSQSHSQCICKSVSQIDDGKNLECTNCHYQCLTCYGPEMNNCLTCYDKSSNSLTISRSLKYGLCSCPTNWYDDQINETCLKCHISCDKCFYSDEYSCITCSELNHRVLLTNSCHCQDGYFENLKTFICEQCEYKCGTCKLDKSNCQSCLYGSFRTLIQQTSNINYKTCQCPSSVPNDVQGNPICQICHFTCQNCTDNGLNQCTMCDSTANRVIYIDPNGSYCKCALQYYEIKTPECAQCSSYCLGCVDTATNCISCDPLQFRELDVNKCKCASRFGPLQLSYFDNMKDPECIACHYSCYTCNGPQYDQCLTCGDLDFRTQQGSECICKPQYIDNGEGTCMICNQSCETCDGQKNLCTSCPDGSLRTLNVQSQSCDCPWGYFDSGAQICEKCDVKCSSCINQSTTCLSCVSGSNRILNQFSNSCDCLQGYYDLGTKVCEICHYSCLQCSGPNSSDCISCPNYIATRRTFIGSSCLCLDQFFDDQNNKLCQPCSSTCLTCQINQNSCTMCVIGQNRVLNGQQCICQSSYYESGSPSCSKCFDKCQECQITSTACTKCDSYLNRTLDQSKCICIPGYFDDGTLICKQCHYSCQTCLTFDQNCTSCNSMNFRQLNQNQCLCINGTIDQGAAMCFSRDTRCLTCTNITTQCLSCDSTKLRIQSGQTCNCKDGYYENNVNQCIVCDTNCLTCQNTGSTCTSCNLVQAKILDQTYKCACKNGYYADLTDLCQQCSIECQTCSETASKCISCFSDRVLQTNQCNCLSGFYDSSSGCQRCSDQCTTCQNSATQCLSCDPISNRYLQSQQCICNQGYFDIGAFICAQCSQTCLTCQSQNTNCKSCDKSLKRILNGTHCNCMPGYYSIDQDKQCQQCNISCITCIDISTKCTSCDIATTFRLDQSIGLNQCPCIPGFYDEGSITCKKCSYKCLNCIGQQDNCTICHINSGYFRNNILPTCECQAGYFDDGVQVICQKCGPKCQTCEIANNNCLVCESQSARLAAPQCDCKPGYFEDAQLKCQICSSNCLTCAVNQDSCLTCQPDRTTKDCVCDDGYYEANLPICQPCSYKCSTCAQDPLNCLTCASDRENSPNCLCKNHFYDDQLNALCQECDQYCGKCDLNGCIDCSGNRILSGKTCICPIHSISYTHTPYCSNCDVAVIKGLFSDEASQLIYIFEYDLQFNFPVQTDKQAYCSLLILSESLKLLGEAPQCIIQEKQLIISLGSGSQVIVGDFIQFNSTILKHKDCFNPIQIIIRTQLLAPKLLLMPSIKINYPNVPVSPCAQINVIIEQQFVNGQRNLQLEWSSSLSIQSLQQSLQQANQLQFQTLTIEQGQMPQNSEIDISVTFTNFLSQSDKITIKLQTLSATVPQFLFKTIKNTYFSWVPIKILVYFSNSICTGGVQTKLYNPVQVKFEEIVQNRLPSQSNAIAFQQQIFNQQDSDGMISAIIPQRTLSVNSNYSILSTFVDLLTNQEVTAQLDITIKRSPLIVEIIGGSRIQNYLKPFKIEIQSKDPDYQTQWNQDPDINLFVECIDLQHGNKPCIDQFDKIIPLNKTSNIQHIASKLFLPFTVLLFRVKCQKQNQEIMSTSAQIIMLDVDLPTINVSYPEGYNIRDVNINEKLQFQMVIDQNQLLSNLEFSIAILYNYETVHVKKIPNQNLTFAIWEGFQKFNFINQISIKFQAHDINYLMPSVKTVTLSVNMPPVGSIINITPQNGLALFTYYSFRVTNAKDIQSPILYRFAQYQSQRQYQDDIISGDYENLQIIQDFTTVQTQRSILESGNLTILISVADSLGSTVNYTYQIKSQSFYEQWQLTKEENTTINSSYCKQMVQELEFSITDLQQLTIAAIEFLKLLEQNIQQDCIQPINQVIKKIQDLLFDMMIKQSSPIIQSRILNVLAKIYKLNINKKTRLIQTNDQICFNTSNNRIQFKQLTYNSTNVTDNHEIVEKIQLIEQLIHRAIEINSNITQDYSQIQDIGDDYTARSLIQNQELRKSFLRVLGSLYNQVYEQKINISILVDKLMNSFQQNLILDDSLIKIQTNGFGIQLYKIGQKSFQTFLVKEPYNSDYDLNNFTINRYIQLVKYRTNKYLYTNEFKSAFKNNTKILYKNETTKYIYIKSIIPYLESHMFDIQIYVDNKEGVNLVKYIHQGKLQFNMGTNLQACADSSTYDQINSYNFVCSSFINDNWEHESCQLEFQKDNQGEFHFKCLCKHTDPLTLMIMNVSNLTKSQSNERQKIINLEEFIRINIFNNMTLLMFLFCVISIIVVVLFIRIRKQQINLSFLKQKTFESEGVEELTKKTKMSVQLFKHNLKYLHEINRLIFVNYKYLSLTARILLAIISINTLITFIHVFNVVIKNRILPVVISLFMSIIFQVCVKVLEGFLNGPQILKVIGYIIVILLNIGILSLNIVINSDQYNPVLQLIQTIIGLIILQGPIEIIIQYIRLRQALIIYDELKSDPMNPVINLLYYFLQDEIVTYIISGELIQ